MLRPISILLTSATLLSTTASGLAQADFWQQTGGPKSAHVKALAIKSSNTVFAGTSKGILCSSDHGENWVESGLSNTTVNALMITPEGVIFAGTEGEGIFRSRDNGLSWEAGITGLPGGFVYSVAVSPGGDIFATESSTAGIYRSVDAGNHWTLVSNSSNGPLAIDAKGYIFAGSPSESGGRLMRSTDNGASWSVLPLQLEYDWVTSLAVNSHGGISAGTSGKGIFRSTNDGASWDSASVGLTSPWVTSLVAMSEDTILAATLRGGVFRTTDGAESWKQSGLRNTVRALAAAPGGYLFAGGTSMFRSTNDGDTWSALSAGWRDLAVSGLAIHRTDTIYAAADGALFRSADNGNSWLELGFSGIITPENGVWVNSRGHVFASDLVDMWIWRLYRSTDNGDHWVPLPHVGSAILAFNDSDHIFQAFGGVLRSTDNGDSWDSVNSGLADRMIGSLAITRRGDVFAGTWDGGGVYRSTNNGASWDSVNNGLTNRFVRCLATSFAGEIFVGTSGAGNDVFCSTNNGQSWTYLYSLPSSIRAMTCGRSGELYVATDTMGVYRDGQPMESGSTKLDAACIALSSDGYLFAGTNGRSVFRSVQSTPVNELSGGSPTAFLLEQNYPNPFNPKTVIRFQLPAASTVRLVVYDLLGREVAVLVNEKRSPGTYEVTWEATGFASGVYFCRLAADGSTTTRKLSLTR